MLVFQTTLPSVGPGKLIKRDDSKLFGTDKEKLLYTPHESFYTALAPELVKNHVGVDIFLCGAERTFVDTATIGI
jgi:protein transport protein SEC24